jgi:CheY-like chemotaxis protein
MTNPKVLYVEDYPVVQEIYIAVLKDQGFDVTLAGDGKEAMILAKEKDFDVILLDLLLPQVSGLEFLERYKAIDAKKREGTTLIVLTDFDNPATVETVKQFGVEHYWMKVENTPYTLADNLKKLLHIEEAAK